MEFALWTPLVGPLVLAVLSLALGSSPARRFLGLASSVVVLASGVLLVTAVMNDQVPTAGGGMLRADALSAYMLTVVGAVGLISTWGGLKTAADSRGQSAGIFEALISLFLAAMSLAVLADSIGLMWAAIEATTITTAFLVGHHRTRSSLEAAWKYVILGSVGVAIALLGIVLIYAASRETETPTLSWLLLSQADLPLDPALITAGGALAVLGFATKSGLAPMHSWLPDAHSQAPAPVSGLMSGVLLAVALYAILRIQTITNLVIGPDFLRTMLSIGGLLSLAIAASLLIRQVDYKRMLAYSSIEHMGLMALGVAIGPAALPAVLLYMLGHGLIKATLFVISGRILHIEGTPVIANVRALLARRPGLAVPWLVAMAALVGFPPFSIFFSEVGIIMAGWAEGMGLVVMIALFLLLVIFAGLTRLTMGMVLGSPAPVAEVASATGSIPSGSTQSITTIRTGSGDETLLVRDFSTHGPILPIILALAVTASVAFIAHPIGDLLERAVAVLGGTN
ncbi:hydrogenase [Cryobacterium melibiosiphilum]|uniref:Hydrogenase n=1 Tax=Cryobacterium melibiosiphilum TaxID=995039 RepID=A0A3A5MMS7_9MICO|nr:proton-conducting transporter membrane subunit [Cryobacterium melibiosiphilum]RJT87336.1 hydrogenase [Cryobacterium melibiosiphilum]